MYFLDNNSGVNAMPEIAPVNSTSVRWFTEGSGSLPPSWPGMDWFNIVQAELIGVLTAAGMSPDKARVDQLAAAIKSIIGSNALLKDNFLSEIKEAGSKAQQSARGNLGLGASATKNVGTSDGNVLGVGDLGLSNALKALSSVDLNTIQTFGFYVIQNPVNGPAGSSGGTLFLNVATWQSGTGAAGYRVAQEVIGYGQSGSTGNRVWRRTWTGSIWSGWIEFYSEAHKPTASDADAYPIKGGNLQGSMNAIGSIGTQGGAFFIRTAAGIQIASISASANGAITFYSDVTGKSFGLDGAGNFTTIGDSLLCEQGRRVYGPNNPPPSQTAWAVDGSPYWNEIDSRTGRITQGGLINRGGDSNPITFPITFPNACKAVFLTQSAQGTSDSSQNIIASSVTRTGFTAIMRSNETWLYWMAIGS